MKVQEIALDKIEQNENSRVVYKESDLADLMTSMREHGLLQPVGVRKLPNGSYDAVFGNRRIVAAKKLGWANITAHIVENAKDDEERDILNLVENVKRQNTTLAEDGRIFQKLKDAGLKVPEIAARVGITTDRVDLALETFNEIPDEYHKKIKNVGHCGTKKRAGTIAASAAHEILKLRKEQGLNRDQTRQLLDYAKQEDASLDQIRMISPFVKEGADLNKAMELVKDVQVINLRVFLRKKEIKKLEKKEGKSINQVVLDYLEEFPACTVTRRLALGRPNFKLRHPTERAVAMGPKR